MDAKLVKEEYIYELDGRSLRIFFNIDYERNVATVTFFAEYFRDTAGDPPTIHVYYEDELDGEDVYTLPIIPDNIDQDAEVSMVEYDFGNVVASYSVALGTSFLRAGTLHKRIPIERANMLVERLPKGLLRYHAKTYKKGKKVWTVTEQFSA